MFSSPTSVPKVLTKSSSFSMVVVITSSNCKLKRFTVMGYTKFKQSSSVVSLENIQFSK